jgi:hypothetical protein
MTIEDPRAVLTRNLSPKEAQAIMQGESLPPTASAGALDIEQGLKPRGEAVHPPQKPNPGTDPE